MSMAARLHNQFGGSGKTWSVDVTGKTSVYVPDPCGCMLLSGTAVIDTITASTSSRNRRVLFIQTGTGGTNFIDSTTIKIATGGVTLSQNTCAEFFYNQDGIWYMISTTPQ